MTKKLLTKVAAGMATGGMLLAALGPAAAFADYGYHGGGSIKISNYSYKKVVENNYAKVGNVVITSQNTGNNAVIGGGFIHTGDNDSSVIIINHINQ